MTSTNGKVALFSHTHYFKVRGQHTLCGMALPSLTSPRACHNEPHSRPILFYLHLPPSIHPPLHPHTHTHAFRHSSVSPTCVPQHIHIHVLPHSILSKFSSSIVLFCTYFHPDEDLTHSYAYIPCTYTYICRIIFTKTSFSSSQLFPKCPYI